MTEQPPHETIEPRSPPENLTPPDAFAGPNALEEASHRRTALIVWGLVGLVFAGGVGVMAMTWREALPSFDGQAFEAPQIEIPQIEMPFGRDDPRPPTDAVEAAPAPEGMARSQGRDAEPVGRSDKPPAE